ncbi:MAG: prolyl oligopeptidase family serine peptidase [Acidobacteriia bacterium]|nr:prolyl oligopeptidase family serine peptidase [Terriglobia bacterium]
MARSRTKRCAAVLFLLMLPVWSAAPARISPAEDQAPATSLFTVDDMLDVVTLRAADLSEDGRWLAATASTSRDRIGIDNSRFGDPTYVAPSLADVLIIDIQTGKSQKLFPEKRQIRGLKWSPDGSRLVLAVLKGDRYQPVIWERATGKLIAVPVPGGKILADNSEWNWTPAGDQLIYSLRSEEWRKQAAERFRYETRGPVVVHSSKEPFLAWDDLRRMTQLRSIAAYDIAAGQTREIMPEKRVNSTDLAQDGTFLTYLEDITKKTDYDVINGNESQVQLLPLGAGPARTIIKSTKDLRIVWSRARRHYAYAKKGDIFFASIDDKEPRQLTGKEEKPEKEQPPAEPPVTDVDKAKEKESFSAVQLSPKGEHLVISGKKGLWMLDTATGSKEMFLTMDAEDPLSPRYQVIDWDPAGESVYLSYASRTKWERGLVRYDLKAKKLEDLIKDGRLYSDFRLSEGGGTFVFAGAEGNRPADLYAADAGFKNVRRLTDGNPQLKAKRLGKTELISYMDADGKKLYGVLYYPVDSVAGQKYPVVFLIYEQFFDDTFNGTISILNSNGYAVMQPSVNLEIGFPGEAWAKGVTSAANKLIESGIADPDRLGVQGTSYGGYATNLLITQTNRFKAAINISGKVNMVSFYTDSPRLGVRNIHAPEKSQDRIGATLWQQPQKYIQHSAIMFADRIKTPLLLMSGELDTNVPARQAMEMYYALRRLGKDVEWVQYMDGGHGMPTVTVDEVKDYHKRILDWYDSHLKGDLKKKDNN